MLTNPIIMVQQMGHASVEMLAFWRKWCVSFNIQISCSKTSIFLCPTWNIFWKLYIIFCHSIITLQTVSSKLSNLRSMVYWGKIVCRSRKSFLNFAPTLSPMKFLWSLQLWLQRVSRVQETRSCEHVKLHCEGENTEHLSPIKIYQVVFAEQLLSDSLIGDRL